MLTELKTVASTLGITLVILESDKTIENQLNRIIRIEDMPLALVTWDLTTSLEFDESGFLKNPTTDITMLLVTKADTLERYELEASAEEMGKLFIQYIKAVKNYLTANTNVKQNPITGISYTFVPSFSASKHSGVLATFKIQENLEENAC
jgi:hypothetical protein